MSTTEDTRAALGDEIAQGIDTVHAELDEAFRTRVAAQQARIDEQKRILDTRDGVTTRYSYASGQLEPVAPAEAPAEDVEPVVRIVGITGDVTLPEDLPATYGDTVTLRLTARVTEVRTRAGYIADAPTRKRWELTVETLDIVDGTAVESGPNEVEAVTAAIIATTTARAEARRVAALKAAAAEIDARPRHTRRPSWLLPLLVFAGVYAALFVAPFLLFTSSR